MRVSTQLSSSLGLLGRDILTTTHTEEQSSSRVESYKHRKHKLSKAAIENGGRPHFYLTTSVLQPMSLQHPEKSAAVTLGGAVCHDTSSSRSDMVIATLYFCRNQCQFGRAGELSRSIQAGKSNPYPAESCVALGTDLTRVARE